MEDIKALHFFIPGHHVPNRVIPHMAHVDLSRRIGKHFKKIIFFFLGILCHLKELLVFPDLLPFSSISFGLYR